MLENNIDSFQILFIPVSSFKVNAMFLVTFDDTNWRKLNLTKNI